MEQNDAQLIQRILQGDQEAFSPLVKKHQKGVHALVWRKIGDFHIAQEITQDAFLTAYKKTRNLEKPYPILRLALRYCGKFMSRLVPKESHADDGILRCY